MNDYTYLSKVYDLSMEDRDYKNWSNLIKNHIKKSGTYVKNILELGCGSGNITLELLKAGYEVVGIDSSDEMLELAREKTYDFGQKIILVNQDINELDFEIYEIDMIIATNDVFNYITKEESLIEIFDFAKTHLKKDGLLFFDISSENKLKNILSNNVFSEEFEDYYYVWKNYFDEKTSLLDIQIDIFEKIAKNTYKRYEEYHIQRAYTHENIINNLKKSGFNDINYFCDFDENNKDEKNSNRIFYEVKK